MLSPFYGNVTGTSIPCYHNVTKANDLITEQGAGRIPAHALKWNGMLFL